jgi:tight adherence protein B
VSVVGSLRSRRRERADAHRLGAQLPDVARALARGVAAGLPLPDACSRAAAALDEPAGGVLRGVAGALLAGTPAPAALAPLAAVPGGPLMVGAVVLHDELGGDLAHGLHALADGLADRERLRAELLAVTAQARLAARLVPVVPLAAAGMLAAASPASIGPLVGTPLGHAVLGASGALTLLGLALIRRVLAEAAP